MAAGDSAQRRAEELREKERKARAQAEYFAAEAARHEIGRDGEQRLAAWSEPLMARGYYRLDDIGIPGSQVNIDHVLIGPAGVFVVDAKNWSGGVDTRGSALRQNGRDRTGAIQGVRDQSAAVHSLVCELLPGRRIPVWPTLAFVGAASVGTPRYLSHVLLVDGRHLVAQVESIAPILSPDEVAHLRRGIASSMLPRTSSAEHAGDRGHAIAPNEDIVFLVPWSNYGKRRIYVKDEFGAEGGYLDLLSGTVERTTPASNAILAHLVPHFARLGDDEVGSGDDHTIAQFLSWFDRQPVVPDVPPLVVGYDWRARGVRRIYLHYLFCDGKKVDLGWVEFGGVRRVHAEIAGWEPVIRYCGRQYEAIEASRRVT